MMPPGAGIVVDKFKCYYRGQLIARLTEVDSPKLNGLTDPSSVLWELTPWSFVIDWFIPIGNYLNARGLAQATTGTYVYSWTSYEKWSIDGYVHPTPNTKTTASPSIEYMYLQVWRSISTSVTTPRPRMKPLGEVLSWKRAANAVALLTQMKFR